jgi:hypothetical protein
VNGKLSHPNYSKVIGETLTTAFRGYYFHPQGLRFISTTVSRNRNAVTVGLYRIHFFQIWPGADLLLHFAAQPPDTSRAGEGIYCIINARA